MGILVYVEFIRSAVSCSQLSCGVGDRDGERIFKAILRSPEQTIMQEQNDPGMCDFHGSHL